MHDPARAPQDIKEDERLGKREEKGGGVDEQKGVPEEKGGGADEEKGGGAEDAGESLPSDGRKSGNRLAASRNRRKAMEAEAAESAMESPAPRSVEGEGEEAVPRQKADEKKSETGGAAARAFSAPRGSKAMSKARDVPPRNKDPDESGNDSDDDMFMNAARRNIQQTGDKPKHNRGPSTAGAGGADMVSRVESEDEPFKSLNSSA